MNALFIWNSHSKEYVKQHVARMKQFKGECHFITSKDEYDRFIASFENMKGKGKADTTPVKKNAFTHIYICVELDWCDLAVYGGYDVGYDLIRSINLPEFCICFYSFQSRKNIYRQIPDKHRFLVKALPFEDILSIKDSYKFPTENIAGSKLHFFKTYAFLDYGIIDDFAHRLKGISEKQPGFETALESQFREIAGYKEIIGTKIQAFLSKISVHATEARNQLIQLLEERVSELSGEKTAKPKAFESNYRILVVEDSVNDMETIRTSLRRYYGSDDDFTQNTLFLSSGEEALSELKANGDNFDFIITDLELLDEEGFYQRVQGVEVYDYASTRLKKTVTGVITGYGRKGIEKLLRIQQEFILSKQHIHRFGGDEEIDRLMLNLLHAYKQRERSAFYDVGPEKGIFERIGYRTELSRLINEDREVYHTGMWEEARRLAGLYINNTLLQNTPGWSAELISAKSGIRNIFDFIKEKHAALLAHRLIVLHYYLMSDKAFDEADFKDKVSGFMQFDNYGKDYLTTRLGFHRSLYYSKRTDPHFVNPHGNITKGKYADKSYKTIHTIEFKKLFPEERTWISEHQQAVTAIKLKDNTTHTIPWLTDTFKIYFPDENFDAYTFSDLAAFYETSLLEKYNSLNADKDSQTGLYNVIEGGVPPNVAAELNDEENRIIEKAIGDLNARIDPE